MKVIIGTWQLGGSSWASVDPALAEKTVTQAAAQGHRDFDTAPSYGDGKSEEALGRILKKFWVEEFRITTKVSPDQLRCEQIIASVRGSLERLGVKQIENVLIHWPAGTMGTEIVASEEVAAGLNQVLAAGLTRKVGVCNFNLAQLQEILALTKISTAQYPLSLAYRAIEDEVLPFLKRHQIDIQAYSPLAQGLLTIRPTISPKEGDHRNWVRLFKSELRDETLKVRADLDARFGANLSRYCLSWVLSKGATPIVGIHRPEHLELLQQDAQVLSAGQWQEVEAAGAMLKARINGEISMWGGN